MKNLILLLVLFFASKSFAVLNLNQTPRLDYNLAVMQDMVSNAKVAHGFFESLDLTTTEKTVWHGPGIYVYPATAIQMTVSSSSALDTLAGTGAQKVSIDCLDINYEPFTEIVELNGQTPVTMTGSCYRVQGTSSIVVQVGALEANQGTIYIGTGVVTLGIPATIYNLVPLGENKSDSGFYTVPAGYNGYFIDVESSSVSNKPLKMRGIHRNGIPVFTTFWANNIDGFVKSEISYPDKFKEKTDIQFRATMASGTGEVLAHAHLLLIK